MSCRTQRVTGITHKIIALMIIISLGWAGAAYAAEDESTVSEPAGQESAGPGGESLADQPCCEENAPDPAQTLAARVEQIVNAMSLEQKVGQMFMMGFNGPQPDFYITQMIEQRHLGGVVLFRRNLQNREQVTALNEQLQQMALENNDLPLFIAADQEGGVVDRFKDMIAPSPAPPQLGQTESAEAVALLAQNTALELTSMGVNVNLAPVMDVAFENSVMEKRAYSSDPKRVAELGAAAVAGYRQGGVFSCGKHFPGLGRSTNDTHTGAVEISASLAEMNAADWLPFRQAMAAGLEMVMVNHALYPSLDAVNPASVSPTIQQCVLRDMLGYSGLVLSDDLEMGAVTELDTIGRLAVRAVNAGTDILLVCHTPAKQKEAYDAIVAAVKAGEIDPQRIDDSLKRIVALKLQGEADAAAENDSVPVNPPEHDPDAAAPVVEAI